MVSVNALARIQDLFAARGTLVYGEAVNQIEHALQCATLAERSGAPAPMIMAAWLHDIGHLQHHDAAAAVRDGVDDAHELLGAKLLGRWFGPAVSEPVRLHVQAKRYLCTREDGYWDRLSTLSRQTLLIQGGPMSEGEARCFEQEPFHADALRLRRWDDSAKVAGALTRSHAHFMGVAASVIQAALGAARRITTDK